MEILTASIFAQILALELSNLKISRVHGTRHLKDRPVARGMLGCDATPNLPEGPFYHKMGQGELRGGGVRFKKSTFWVQKVNIFGVPHPQDQSWLRACSKISLQARLTMLTQNPAQSHTRGGGHLYLKLDIIRVKGLSKHTLNTYFSGMKIDPKYAFLHAFFLI